MDVNCWVYWYIDMDWISRLRRVGAGDDAVSKPEDITEAAWAIAEEAFDLMLCNCIEASGTTEQLRIDSIEPIARAIQKERTSDLWNISFREPGGRLRTDHHDGDRFLGSTWIDATGESE